jgi:hypothetical protein
MAMSSLTKQIIDFVNSAEFKSLDAFYARPSIFSALGVSRHENTHSNFLAWLFTPRPLKNDHGLNDTALRKLLETLALVCDSLPHAAEKLPPGVVGILSSGDYSLSNITVEREKHIGDGRIDIYLAGTIAYDGAGRPFAIAIENKIKSSEHDAQTVRYREALRQIWEPTGLYLGIYLTPLNNGEYERLDEPRCEAKEFIQLNYQYLADSVIAPSRAAAAKESVKQYLDEYLFALGLPELRQNKGDVIMATSGEERALLARFWDKHKELLIAAILSITDTDILDDAERKIVKKASQTLHNAAQRDMTRYAWACSTAGETNLSKSRLVLKIVAHYVHNNAPLTFAELKQIFPDALQGGDFGVFAPLAAANPKNFKGHKRYAVNADEIIELSDGYIAVTNQWGIKNINAFIARAVALGYVITPLNSTEQNC